GFGKHETTDVSVPVGDRGGKTPLHETLVDGLVLGREQAQGDLRSGTIVRDAYETALGIGYAYRIAWSRSGSICNVAGEDPRVPTRGPVSRFAVYSDRDQDAPFDSRKSTMACCAFVSARSSGV